MGTTIIGPGNPLEQVYNVHVYTSPAGNKITKAVYTDGDLFEVAVKPGTVVGSDGGLMAEVMELLAGTVFLGVHDPHDRFADDGLYKYASFWSAVAG